MASSAGKDGMRCRLRLVACALLALAASGAGGELRAAARTQAERLFREGNSQYEKQQFARAWETYREVLRAGYASAELFLNLGNASYRSGESGWAAYYYELARRRAPWDPDIQSNLALAQRAALGAEPHVESSAFLSWLARGQNRLTVAGAVWISTILLWIAAGLLAVSWHWTIPLRRRLPLNVAVGAALVAALLLATKVAQSSFAPEALIVEAASARTEPSDNGTVEFRLPAASPVQLARRVSGWREVIVSKSLRGWVHEEEVAEFRRPR